MPSWLLAAAITCLLCTPLTADQTLQTQPDYDFSIHGSNTLGARLVPDLLTRFFQQQGWKIQLHDLPGENERVLLAEQGSRQLRVGLFAHGSSTGFRALQNQAATLWASSRPATLDEIHAMRDRADLTDTQSEHIVAIDGLAVLVHPDNPLTELTIAQLANLFSGDIRNWAQLGGPNLPVRVHARDNRSGTWDTFQQLVLKTRQLDQDAHRYESNAELAERVSLEPGSIGFSSIASTGKAKVLAIADGQAQALSPSRLNLATEDYPLTRRLFFYSLSQPNHPVLADFVKFATSTDGQAQVMHSGFISQTPVALTAQLGTQTPQSFRRLTQGYQRLSTNFRFKQGWSKLDNKAHQDIRRVAEYVKQQGWSGRELMLIGFSDNGGDEFRAQILSEARALTVAMALKREGIDVRAHTGYGQYMPVSTGSGTRAQHRNGRVEVWIRSERLSQASLISQAANPAREATPDHLADNFPQ